MVYPVVDSKSGVKIQERYQVLEKRLYYDPFSFIFGPVPKTIQMLCQTINFISISLLSSPDNAGSIYNV